jgi:hypothetical protein
MQLFLQGVLNLQVWQVLVKITMGAFAPQAFGQAAANPITGSTLGAQFGNTTIGKGITGALGKSKLTQTKQ